MHFSCFFFRQSFRILTKNISSDDQINYLVILFIKTSFSRNFLSKKCKSKPMYIFLSNGYGQSNGQVFNLQSKTVFLECACCN